MSANHDQPVRMARSWNARNHVLNWLRDAAGSGGKGQERNANSGQRRELALEPVAGRAYTRRCAGVIRARITSAKICERLNAGADAASVNRGDSIRNIGVKG